MGLDIGFTARLDGTQLSKVAGPGAAGRVKSDDEYGPTVLAVSPTTQAAVREAITAQWGECFPLTVWASRDGDHYLTEVTMHVANDSDRSDEVLDAKREVMIKVVAARCGVEHLDTTPVSG